METEEKQAQGYVLISTEGAMIDKYEVVVGQGCATISIKFVRTNTEKQAQLKLYKYYDGEENGELLSTVKIEK